MNINGTTLFIRQRMYLLTLQELMKQEDITKLLKAK